MQECQLPVLNCFLLLLLKQLSAGLRWPLCTTVYSTLWEPRGCVTPCYPRTSSKNPAARGSENAGARLVRAAKLPTRGPGLGAPRPHPARLPAAPPQPRTLAPSFPRTHTRRGPAMFRERRGRPRSPRPPLGQLPPRRDHCAPGGAAVLSARRRRAGRVPTSLGGGDGSRRDWGAPPGLRGRGLKPRPSFLLACRHAPLARTDPRHGRRGRVYPRNEGLGAAVAVVVFAAAANAAKAELENISGLRRPSPQPARSQDGAVRRLAAARARDAPGTGRAAWALRPRPRRPFRPPPRAAARRSAWAGRSFPSRGRGSGRTKWTRGCGPHPPRHLPSAGTSPRREGPRGAREPRRRRRRAGPAGAASRSAATMAVALTGNFWKWRQRGRGGSVYVGYSHVIFAGRADEFASWDPGEQRCCPGWRRRRVSAPARGGLRARGVGKGGAAGSAHCACAPTAAPAEARGWPGRNAPLTWAMWAPGPSLKHVRVHLSRGLHGLCNTPSHSHTFGWPFQTNLSAFSPIRDSTSQGTASWRTVQEGNLPPRLSSCWHSDFLWRVIRDSLYLPLFNHQRDYIIGGKPFYWVPFGRFLFTLRLIRDNLCMPLFNHKRACVIGGKPSSSSSLCPPNYSTHLWLNEWSYEFMSLIRWYISDFTEKAKSQHLTIQSINLH